MKFTYTNIMLHGRQEPSKMDCNPAVIVFGIFLICLIVMAPMIWTLIWTRHDNPEYIRRRALREVILPTREVRPAHQDGPQTGSSSIISSMRMTASRAHGDVAAAGTAVASRSRDAFLDVQTCLAKLSPVSVRRRRSVTASSIYDLPIMRRPAWQKLAESHTGINVDEPEGVVAGKGTGTKEGAEVGSTADARALGSGGVDVDVGVQKPKVVLIVGRTA